MTSIRSVIEWLAEHGYRLSHRRADAVTTGRYLYVFTHPRRRTLAVGVTDGQVRDSHWTRLANVVLTDEENTDENA